MTEERKVYAVDFDNTLTLSNAKYWEGERPEPDPRMVDICNEIYFDRNTIIVWTARPWSEAGRIAGHLTEWGVRFHGIRCDKGSAHHYIDDKAINAEDFIDDRTPDMADEQAIDESELTTLQEELDDAE